MITCAALLAAYTAAIGFGGPALLRRGWTAHDPRLAIIAWLALPTSCVASTVLAAAVLAPPAGLTLAGAILARAGWCLARAGALSRRERREHAAFLAAAGRVDRGLGVVVLDLDAPAAYCLPGAPGPVVSAGTLAALRPGQLRAVLAHERAHLRGRHHAVLTWAGALGRAFPVVPLLAQAAGHLAVLAEMAADDAAVRRHPAGDLASALVILAKAGARTSVLTAGGPAALARVQRLLASPASGRPGRLAAAAAAAAALVPPALLACLLLAVAACDVMPRS